MKGGISLSSPSPQLHAPSEGKLNACPLQAHYQINADHALKAALKAPY